MDDSDKSFSNLFGILKSWMPRRSESTNVSRDFWMPDHSCRVCYDCDSEFTLFNRRHHCRLCGRVFCGGCTANSIPAQSCEWGSTSEDWDRIRVCNYCFKQWEQGLAASVNNGIQITSINLSPSPSATSFISTKTSGTADTTYTPASMQHSAGSYQQHSYPFEINPQQSAQMETNVEKEGILASTMNSDHATDKAEPSPDPFSFCMNRSDDDESGVYQLDSKTGDFPDISQYYGPVQFDEIENVYRSYQFHPDGEDIDTKSMSNYSVRNSFDSKDYEGVQHLARKAVNDMVDECEAPTSLYAAENVESEPVDFENNGLLWLPPEPEDEEDEREAFMFDDDDDDGDATGEWGYLHGSSSFGSVEFRNREKSNEQHKKAMKNVVDGHFRALVAQLLQVENLSLAEEEESENWLEIVTSLSWEAASILKPDMSTGGGMDPGGYVKIKCLASGHRRESMVIKGVVCKKNVANRRMSSKIEKPRFLILGGALEYQRVSNLLSSVDTLLKQEADHLKMAVAKIDAHNPDVLLVEKSVSRHAQECLLKKDISLVLNIKRPLLERIARCTGGQIVPSIDHLSSQKLGYCDLFHVDKFVQEHGTTDQSGKKMMKTLMYFEGCPKPFGCTILLRGASEDELKKVKHVVQYGVFAAYHLALETSFLADEGASLPELPLNAPLTVTLPDKSSSIDRSISTIPGFSVSVAGNAQGPQSFGEQKKSDSVPTTDLDSRINTSVHITDTTMSPFLSGAPSSQNANMTSSFTNSSAPFSFKSPLALAASDSTSREPFPSHAFTEKMIRGHKESSEAKPSLATNQQDMTGDHRPSNNLKPPQAVIEVAVPEKSPSDTSLCVQNDSDASTFHHEGKHTFEDLLSSKEEFPPSPSDNQSILVSLSSRCVWKGTVCERSHLFRIKYYGSSDKPLGRFLRENLFDQSYRCRSCEMPAEAHVHCYTHRQGTLTISVKRLPEFLLPGEKEGKIWMWHRCLRCPRTNGFPPATRRVLMSDAAWGLSFGKFLELSFSNHAAASRVASCGHSLHRDCLRFYGFGQMVACFRYASIDVHSVYLPPSKLDFNYGNQEWIRRELDEVVGRAELLFSEVLNSLHQVEKRPGTGSPDSSLKAPKSKHRFVDLEGMLHKEKSEFEELVQKISNKEAKKGQPAIDILEINRARRQLLFQSYIWDHRLVYASSLDTNSLQHNQCDVDLELVDKSPCANEKLVDTSSFNCDLSLADPKFSQSRNEGEFESHVHDRNIDYRTEADLDSKHRKEYETTKSSCTNIHGGCNPLELNSNVCKALPDGQVHIIPSLSDTLEAAWTGENHPGLGTQKKNAANPELIVIDSSVTTTMPEKLDLENRVEDQSGSGVFHSASASPLSTRSYDSMEESIGWLGMSFVNFYRSVNKNFLGNAQKLDKLNDYNPVYISSFRESELQGGARLLLPVGVDDTVVPVFDDEPTSIISYALLSPDYIGQLSDESERPKDISEFSFPVQSLDSGHFQSFSSVDEMALKSFRSLGSADESLISLSGSLGAMVLDPLSYTKALHARVSFADDGPLGKVKYTVTCYYAKRFVTLRKICCPSEIDYIRSLSRCKKWGAQGGKSNVFFAKSLDDRFIIKEVTKTELESFIKFAPEYFKYLSASIGSGSPTCLAKILGIYQVSSKHFKGGKETKKDVLVMENLLFGRNLTRLYDLKGSSRSRYNPDCSGSNKVLLDQNLIEAMPTSPIFVGNKAKRLLERAVWNDTSFLASIDVMDYSLLVGVDEENHELVLGIIDFMRQYTWDKHLETWVKASGILGGPKNASPTVISPKQYKKRFRKAMTTYFLMVPDQWSPPTIIQSKSQTDLQEENTQDRATS